MKQNTLKKEGKKDLLASNPHHTYYSDHPNINYKLSNGKTDVNHGGPDSSEPKLNPGTVFSGAGVLHRKRERRENGSQGAQGVLQRDFYRQTPRGRGKAYVVPTLPHTPGNCVLSAAAGATAGPVLPRL